MEKYMQPESLNRKWPDLNFPDKNSKSKHLVISICYYKDNCYKFWSYSYLR